MLSLVSTGEHSLPKKGDFSFIGKRVPVIVLHGMECKVVSSQNEHCNLSQPSCLVYNIDNAHIYGLFLVFKKRLQW